MPPPPLESGFSLGEFPYARVGRGPRTLAVFLGVDDALRDVSVDHKFAAWVCGGLAADRSVYLIGRKRNLPQGYTIRAMAADYARVLDAQIGRTDVMGISMGSAIAQELAINHPGLVRRLVLALAGPRMHPAKLPVFQEWIALARSLRWRELFLEMIGVTYGRGRQAVYNAMISPSDNLFSSNPGDPSDFIVSIEACMKRDTESRLGSIKAPTLVLGGTADELMPEELFHELARAIPNASLYLFKDAGHGVIGERKADFARVVLEFLDAETRLPQAGRASHGP